MVLKRLGFLIVVIAFLGGCIQTSSEPEIISTQIVQAPSATPPQDNTPRPSPSPTRSGAAMTEENTDGLSTAPESFSIQGQIINGTNGSPVATAQEVTARFVGIEDGDIRVYFDESTMSDADGSFRFDAIPTQLGLLSIQSNYADLAQFSDFAQIPNDLRDGILALDLVVYETTADNGAIQFGFINIFLEPIPSQQRLGITQVVEIINTGAEIVYNADGNTFEIPLPRNAQNIQISVPPTLGLSVSDLLQIDETGERPILRGQVQILPGAENRIFFPINYELNYLGNIDFVQPIAHPIEQLVVFIPNGQDIRLSSDQLSPVATESRDDLGAEGFSGYRGIVTLGGGDMLQINLSQDISRFVDTAPSDNFVSEDELAQEEGNLLSDLVFVLGIGFILAGGVFLLYDLQHRRSLTNARGTDQKLSQREALIDEIAALDDDFERGKLDEAAYTTQRAALKAQLRRYFE